MSTSYTRCDRSAVAFRLLQSSLGGGIELLLESPAEQRGHEPIE
jgi:hypothetical protein